jgi:hypothetical protein
VGLAIIYTRRRVFYKFLLTTHWHMRWDKP